MYYPDEIVEEVRSHNDIVDVIGRYVKIQKKGNNYTGLCPFHNEKTPSFSVSQTKQLFKCFGCNESGNVYTFLMKYENISFPEAVKELADRAGIELPEPKYSEEYKRRESKRSQLLEINKEAAKYFYYQLRAPQGEKGLEYFRGRMLSDETMKKFGLGYANITSNDLVAYLRSKGYKDELIVESGLADHSEKYGVHDKFWNRVMFPISDVNHRVIGFGGRVMGNGEPKYLNSPETPVFDKGRNLFGLNLARSSKRKYIILCEGYMDVISMHQAGFDCAVASLGTAFTEAQAKLLEKYDKEIILSYDSDGAGVKAALRAIEILKSTKLNGKVLNLEPYKDPDEFIKNLGTEAFEDRINNAENSFFFMARMLSGNYDMKDPAGKTAFDKALAGKICELPDALERDNYINAMAREYDINPASLREMVLKIAAKTGGVEPAAILKSGINKKKADPDDVRKKPQQLFLTWLVDYPAVYKRVKKYISPEDFMEGIYRQVAERLFADLEEGKVNPASIISLFPDEEEQNEVATLFSTEVENLTTDKDKEKAFREILYALKNNSYEYWLEKIDTDIDALKMIVDGKKALEEIARIRIKLED